MPVKKRLILNFPGFEGTSAVHQIERLTAGGHKTGKLWGFDLSRTEILDNSETSKTTSEFLAEAEKWKTQTRFVQFSWSDIISKYEKAAYPKSLITSLPKYLSFFFDGSALKYAKTSGRYFGFTVYPIILMILFALMAFGLVSLLPALHWGIQIIIAFALFLIFTKFPGDLLYVNLSINDWAFARDMCKRSNLEIESRYELFANHLIEEIEASKASEILIVGHSFGSVWAVVSLAIALKKKPDLLKSREITFLALGSSLLKIGLVREAQYFKQAVESVLKVSNLTWHEIQTKTDFISFYKSDPFEPMGIMAYSATVLMHRVKFKTALSKSRYRKMMKSMYLAHRQYILYCDKRVHFDFQLRCFGPFKASDLAADDTLTTNSNLLAK